MNHTDKLRHDQTRSQKRALLRRFGCSRWMKNCGHEAGLDAYWHRCLTLNSVKLSRIPRRIEPARSWLAAVTSRCNVFAGRVHVAAHLSGTPAQQALSHRVPSSHCGSRRIIRGAKTMRALVLGVLLGMPTIVLAQPIRIGLVVPTAPSLSWLSKQFRIGAQLAIERGGFGGTFEIVPLPMDLRSNVDPVRLAMAVVEYEIHAVVAASTTHSANSLRHLPANWTTPTVVATLADLTAAPDHENRNPYVVDLGIPLKHLQQLAIAQWLECYDIEQLAILYNKDFAWSEAFAEDTKDSAIDTSRIALAWSDSEAPSAHDEAIQEVVERVRRSSRSGIILAGAPWNTADWANSIGLANVNAHIYVGPFASNLFELQQLASRSDSAVFAASQYLSDPDDALQYNFTEDALVRLGWSLDTRATPIALQAYDAISVIAAADNHGLTLQSIGEHWWHQLGTISGIKGELHAHDEVTLSPPIDLLRVDIDGSVRFSTFPTSVPHDARIPSPRPR